MAILQECPVCHRKQKVANKICKGPKDTGCGANLDKLKRAQKVRYWVCFRAEGKQIREPVGTSIADAQAADGKRKAQKKEGRIFDMLPQVDMTMQKVIDDFLDLSSTKKLKSYRRVTDALKHVTGAFGSKLVRDIKTSELNTYCDGRIEKGASPASVTMEMTYAKAAVRAKVNDNRLDIRILNNFMNVKKVMAKGENARERDLTVEEYLALLEAAPAYMKALITIAYNTGMRRGEITGLQWSEVDFDKGFLRLPANRTKEGKAKSIPINHHVRKILKSLPRAIHHDYVLMNNKGNQLYDECVVKGFTKACKKAGLVYGMKEDHGVRIHDMRGTWKLNAMEAGIDKVYRDRILGHSLTGIDKYYVEKRLKNREDLLTKAMDRYTTWLDEEIMKVQEQELKCKS